MLERFDGVLMGLPGQFVGLEVLAFVVGHGGGLMGMCGLVVKFGGTVVWALGHGVLLPLLDAVLPRAESLRYLAIHPPSTVRTVPVT